MSGFQRIGFPTILALATAVLAAVLAAGPARAAQPDVFIEVNPNTIQAGFQVGVRASCGEDLNPASVQSDAFGEITLTPNPDTGLLSGAATVPETTRPDNYHVELRCANGASATAELFVIDMARPTQGPDTGGGGTAAGAAPTGIEPAPVLLGAGGFAALGAGAGLLWWRRRSAPARP